MIAVIGLSMAIGFGLWAPGPAIARPDSPAPAATAGVTSVIFAVAAWLGHRRPLRTEQVPTSALGFLGGTALVAFAGVYARSGVTLPLHRADADRAELALLWSPYDADATLVLAHDAICRLDSRTRAEHLATVAASEGAPASELAILEAHVLAHAGRCEEALAAFDRALVERVRENLERGSVALGELPMPDAVRACREEALTPP